MCDTFHPLRLTTLARELDDPAYAYSWYDDGGKKSRTVDQDPAGVTSHL
jgi:homogentisate 1,2-dioxygenase